VDTSKAIGSPPMKLLDCAECRKGFHCHKCLCCAPLEAIRKAFKLGSKPILTQADVDDTQTAPGRAQSSRDEDKI
jgi:hypothetical protein